MHQFNFPFIFPSHVCTIPEKDHAKSVVVIPFYFQDSSIVINTNTPSEIIQYLEKAHSSILHNGTLFSFVYLPKSNKDVETIVAHAVAKLSKTLNNIHIWMNGLTYNPTLFVSNIALCSKNEWNMKSVQKEVVANSPASIFIVDSPDKINAEIVQFAQAQSESQAFVQYLVKMPSNVLTPSQFGKEIKNFLKHKNLEDKISIEVQGNDYLIENKMGSFYSVAKGSEQEAQLITMKYNGSIGDDKPLVFVGKGLTFDSGGISLKPSKGMDAMKTDMAGAATAAGIIIYCALTNTPVNVVSILACCENMPDGKSLKPGDIVTAMNGKTIEVIDTDAEGRLVLADALVYSQQFQGRYTIDMATLTGACIAALGHVHSGMFSNDYSAISSLVEAGQKIGDTVWHMPMEGYEFLIKSDIADISNLKLGCGAGAQNGAVFLAEFAPENGWVHLDIAGSSSDKNGPNGRPLPLLAEWIRSIV
jgi:leucyl aminopeptidase